MMSLPKKWETKVTIIQSTNDLTKFPLKKKKLIGSLITHEINMKGHQKFEENNKNSIALNPLGRSEKDENESEEN